MMLCRSGEGGGIRRKIVGQILPCIMMSYMCMLTYKGAMLQAPPIGFVHADSYHKVHP